ncbi:MAG: MBL fold metallo-hydrolase [Clostridiaceae bacterium]
MSGYYKATKIADKTWCILECGFDAIYYLEGESRGLLIDTGIGASDLKSFVGTLATKPYDVVLTHGHLDHIGAIGQFGSIYVHPLDVRLIETATVENRIDFMRNMFEMSEGRTPNQDPGEICRSGKNPTFLDVGEGDVFHLGGRDVDVFCTPGHTEGCICLHDSRTNILFVGDTIIYRLLLTNQNLTIAERVKQWREGTRRIYDHLDRFSALYMGHCGAVPENTIRELDAIIDVLSKTPDDLDYSEGVPKCSLGSTQVYFQVPFATTYKG